MDEVIYDGNRVFVRAGKGLCLIQGNATLQPVADGPTAGREIRLSGRSGRWIVRLSSLSREGSLAAFAERFQSLACIERGGALV